MPTNADIEEHLAALENVPNYPFDKTKTKSIYAEDITYLKNKIDELASAGGGGAGAWEPIFDHINDTGAVKIECTTLDLDTDKEYMVYFGVHSIYGENILKLYGSSQIGFVGNGFSSISGSLSGISALPWLSHRSIGPGVGTIHISKTMNGTCTYRLQHNVAGQRTYYFEAMDSNWSGGGQNLTKIEITPGSSNPMVVGSYMRIARWVGPT